MAKRPGIASVVLAGRSAGREHARDPAVVIDAADGDKGAGFFRLLQPPHRRHIAHVERLGERLHQAAAALAEVRPERPVAELRPAAAVLQRRTRRGDRLVFQPAAADAAVKASIRPQHDAGAGLARHRAGGADHAEQAGSAVPFDGFANAGPDLRHVS